MEHTPLYYFYVTSLSCSHKRNRKVVTPLYSPIEIHHYTAAIWKIGVIKMNVEDYNIRIYDIERCVCDAIKFRNKIGMDVNSCGADYAYWTLF